MRATLAAFLLFACLPPLNAATMGAAVGVVNLNEQEAGKGLLRIGKQIPGVDTAVLRELSSPELVVLRVAFAAGGPVTPLPSKSESFRYLLNGRGVLRNAGTTAKVGPGAMGLYPAGTSIAFQALEPSIILAVMPRTPSAKSAGFTLKKQLAPREEPLAADSEHRETPLMSGGAIAVSRIQLNGAQTAKYRAETGTIFIVTEGTVEFQFVGKKIPADGDTLVRIPAGTRYRFSLPAGSSASLLAITVL